MIQYSHPRVLPMGPMPCPSPFVGLLQCLPEMEAMERCSLFEVWCGEPQGKQKRNELDAFMAGMGTSLKDE